MASTVVLRSMTGYGRASGEHDAVSIEVEVRSVNHRYADITWKMPKYYASFEIPLRTVVLKHISRGKIEVSIARKKVVDQSSSDDIQFNRGLYESYQRIYRERLSELGAGSQVFENYIGDILSKPGVIEYSSETLTDIDGELPFVTMVLDNALQALVSMRVSEGEEIGRDISNRVQSLRSLSSQIRRDAEIGPERIKERMIERLKKLTPEYQFDEQRIIQEAAIVADKVDVTEELVRLDSHLAAFDTALSQVQSGKRLDFLVQELGREFNTIGSKAQNADIGQAVVSAKVELEKIREQLQNVE